MDIFTSFFINWFWWNLNNFLMFLLIFSVQRSHHLIHLFVIQAQVMGMLVQYIFHYVFWQFAIVLWIMGLWTSFMISLFNPLFDKADCIEYRLNLYQIFSRFDDLQHRIYFSNIILQQFSSQKLAQSTQMEKYTTRNTSNTL